ncbi:bifunctional hydroxymethylpyrimidine kinase/phosphomethylpyrimidine kinase [Methanosphaerula palustris]|uniref:Phosphomethylpyrimidine kinase n=1 Tax=Methanosphaerula palustris (strain ATCC BAA-1556 / DSM 19958 / E1-9c) TaxID=521011 RepID=B8GHH9_METPE|nr:bifunctional hydroxymethylpyrimidine kinase/phosphomethylpyrimidine kinase [Methanosphaerula palustris]ACL16584.1 phosphomethylpyrimidine kinase [Methanosphaerula palustris E1-9c]
MQRSQTVCACTIAGSDPTGGAGIQADLSTFAAMGVWGLSVITALTAQTPERVDSTWVQPAPIVATQLKVLLEEFHIGAFKTGMLGDGSVIDTITDLLPEGVPLVVDPVLVSSSGHRLLAEEAIELLKERLLPRATVITPNLPETEVLSGLSPLCSDDEVIRAGKVLLDLGAAAVIIKGGHRAGARATDLLITASTVIPLSSFRRPYPVHGTGCCFSAALTALLARGYPLPTAAQEAKCLISRAVSTEPVGRSGMRMVDPLQISSFDRIPTDLDLLNMKKA